MADTYYVTFRLADDPPPRGAKSYDERYSALMEGLTAVLASNVWQEPSSYIMFDSDQSPRQIVARIKSAIDERRDLVVLARIGVQSYFVIGDNPDDAVFALVPHAKKA